MSVVVKKMDMPVMCATCPLWDVEPVSGAGYCKTAGIKTSAPFRGRADFCPLAELSRPHGRLIDADALYEKLWRGKPWWNNMDRDEIALPAVDKAPAVLEAEQ